MRQQLKAVVKRSPLLHGLAITARAGVVQVRDKRRRNRLIQNRSERVRSYLASHSVRKLQMGSGGLVLPGWLNADLDPGSPEVILLDAREPLPFDDRTFDYIFAENMIEHIDYGDGDTFLKDSLRILKPGGRIRMATNDLDVVLALGKGDLTESQQRYIRWIIDRYRFVPENNSDNPSFAVNTLFYCWGHKFLYDGATLRRLMEKAGFAEVGKYAYGESRDENLRNLEAHGKFSGSEEAARFGTMALEGVRPRSS